MLVPRPARLSRLVRATRATFFAALSALALAPSAHAQIWTETGPDAPQTLPGNLTTGTGPLTRINGTIANAGIDADIYCIRITDRANFIAHTLLQTTLDTQLYLFDSNGRGVTFNDDAGANTSQSMITAQFVPANGVYYLAITAYDNDPISAGGEIWTDQPFIGERAPSGPGAAGVLSGWTGTSTPTGAYGIVLQGASFFVDPATPCPPNFTPATSFPVGIDPTSVAIGDFNSDGKPDLAVTNIHSSNVSVLLGTGNGSFGTATDFATGSLPNAVAIGDFNTDGKPDLVVVYFVGSNFSVLLGTGTGSFGAATNFGYGDNTATSVAVADLNGDGRSDLAITAESSPNVAVLFGNGNGTFGPPAHFGVGPNPRSVAIGDFNSDGKPDLAVANGNGGNVSVLLGVGSGTFGAATNFATGIVPNSVAIADLNGDGKPDLAAANSGSDDVSVLLGTGSGSFGAATNFAAGDRPLAVAIGDFNTDGKLDLATSNETSSNVSVLLGTGTGAFSAPTNFGSGSVPRGVKLGDFNGDARLDLVVANVGHNTVTVLLQQPGPSVPTITTQPLAQAIPAGNFAFFTVAATTPAGTGMLAYQWRRNGVNLADVGEIAGSATPTLQISPASLGYNNSAIDCVVTNSCGSATSRPVGLNVRPRCPADLDDGSGTGTPDEGITIDDLLYFLIRFQAGC